MDDKIKTGQLFKAENGLLRRAEKIAGNHTDSGIIHFFSGMRKAGNLLKPYNGKTMPPLDITASTTLQSLTQSKTYGQDDGRFSFQREIPAINGYDLVVAGGGPAGAAAAICAARLGTKVLLVESTGCMGGMGTSGLVTAFD